MRKLLSLILSGLLYVIVISCLIFIGKSAMEEKLKTNDENITHIDIKKQR